ncbi:MAG: DUF3221 domain-containing protein [Clostridia bacterium]|nr:DUF3221 domain-containing protein [Clostridia bacterium]
MRKKIIIVITVFIAVLLLLGIMYLVDRYMMKNNKPVIFSTWGYDYAPPEQNYKVLQITDLSNKYSCAQALEKIYEDSKNEYYFSSIKSNYITVKYENMGEEKIKSALNKGHITLEDLDDFNIDYIVKSKVNDEGESFIATILDKTETYMLVEPDECELETRTADKIVVSFDKENLMQKFGVDDKVIIYYSGSIMESYPARIKADNMQKIE